MLVDITTKQDPVLDEISEIMGSPQSCEQIGTGLYITGLNFEYNIVDPAEHFFQLDGNGDASLDGWLDSGGSAFNSYGVCDSPEQFMTVFGKLLEASPRKICVSFTQIRKSEQPARDGWRWHKWGEYIGTKKPKHEYLADEKDIDDVYVYQAFLIIE